MCERKKDSPYDQESQIAFYENAPDGRKTAQVVCTGVFKGERFEWADRGPEYDTARTAFREEFVDELIRTIKEEWRL